MLQQLTIRDFALVTALDVNFQAGLSVVTGESGAGKSILMNALSLVLGERASSRVIRDGAERAEVTAEFDVSANPAAQNLLQQRALADPMQPDLCLCRRLVARDGRSRAFVNGVPVNLQLLRYLTEGLVDIRGQDENQRLSRPDVQRQLLDAYGVSAANRRALGKAWRAWQATEQRLETIRTQLAQADDRASLLQYQLAELAELDLESGEFESMETEFRRLSRAQDILALVGGAVEQLRNEDNLRHTQRRLDELDDSHPALASARDSLAASVQLLDDAVRDLQAYVDGFEQDPRHLARLTARIEHIHDLARKHRVEPEALAAHTQDLQQALDQLGGDQRSRDALADQAQVERRAFQKIAAAVSVERRGAATAFASSVSERMQALGISGGQLSVVFQDGFGEHGLESPAFHITTSPGASPGPLGQIASGGERARIALAICVIAAEKAHLPCLVLDEADVGVGGVTADTVGRLLRDLGGHTQVICVTHAPQVAVLGHDHLLVAREDTGQIRLQRLSEVGRVDEVARMVAGAEVTDRSRAYARALLAEAGRPLAPSSDP